LGDDLDAAPREGLAQGRTSDAKPSSSLRGDGQGNVRGGTRALPAAEPEPSPRLNTRRSGSRSFAKG
jgi:hypothetical protein